MFAIRLGHTQRFAQLSYFGPTQVPLACRTGHAPDTLGGVPLDLAEANRVLEDRVKR